MTFITTDTAGAYTLTNVAPLTILQGVTMYHDSFSVPTIDINNASNGASQILVAGTIIASGGTAIEEVTTGGGSLRVNVVEGGAIFARDEAVDSENPNTDIHNAGAVAGSYILNGTDSDITTSNPHLQLWRDYCGQQGDPSIVRYP